MTMLGKMLGSAAIAAMLVTSAAPALARPGSGWGGYQGGYGGYGGYGRQDGYGGYGGGYRHHRRGDGDGFGNFLLGAILAGGIVAIATSASKQSSRNRVYEGRSDGRIDGGLGSRDSRDWSAGEKEAANVCADAAENVTSKRGADGKVDDVDRVVRDGEGYRVEGVLVDGRTFLCGVRRGDLSYIQFDDRVARR